jgi:hypothetical protein
MIIHGASNKDNNVKEEEADKSSPDAVFKATKKHIDTAGTRTDKTGDTDPVVLACFQCYGDEKQPDHIRCKMLHDHGCVSRHFHAIHLKQRSFKCNYCEEPLMHEMNLRRHAKQVHRVHT